MKQGRRTILSRHRLPQRYRLSLTALWLAPPVILGLVVLSQWEITDFLQVFDLRLLVPLLLMAVPAAYVWHEGVDILPDGIIRRVFVPRYYAYAVLDTWYFDKRANRRTLTIWDARSRKILECRAGHLTDLPTLLKALHENVRWRNWPN